MSPRGRKDTQFLRTPIEQCPTTGKVKFDKRGAITAANKRFEESHVKLRVYECDDCGHWHLTHSMRRPGYGKPSRGHGKMKRW